MLDDHLEDAVRVAAQRLSCQRVDGSVALVGQQRVGVDALVRTLDDANEPSELVVGKDVIEFDVSSHGRPPAGYGLRS